MKEPKVAKTQPTQRTRKIGADDFESVAQRLECDMDDKRFREKLGKIARAKAAEKKTQ